MTRTYWQGQYFVILGPDFRNLYLLILKFGLSLLVLLGYGILIETLSRCGLDAHHIALLILVADLRRRRTPCKRFRRLP